ncbi:helix-turn-helix domain-containing protein [Nitratireductor sp. ZSWI3]|uniref:winged helix-turn-helix transcriptional regulator n=1 Tax=Nitratireductor sp. ZSWI3 TaxID=2966359 RepID=UPI00215036B9|nr:helix-turn-helix domain-containing protein [Nitratireductor sp. ZSWI3]MCR4265719.1 helix-turn-helix transcriptional regulator [Nitratireductor sp. ZSWI3]
MKDQHRSGCPINLALEILGDKWSLIILRDMMFGNHRHFRDLLNNSMEKIASNILADRLRRLTAEGIISRTDDPSHKQKAIYSLTEKGIDLVPVFAMIGAWGSKWLPVSEELSIRAHLLHEGGPALWDEFMDDLRVAHLGQAPARAKSGPTVRERLQAAYEEVAARKAG